MTPDVIVAIVVPAATNAAVLIYYAGSLNRAMAEHDRRLDVLETNERQTALAAAENKGRELA